jgi:hypothetical protein
MYAVTVKTPQSGQATQGKIIIIIIIIIIVLLFLVMEHWGNENDGGKLKYSREKPVRVPVCPP